MSAAGERRATLMVAAAACSWGCWSLFVRPSGLSSWATAVVLLGVTAASAAALIPLDEPIAGRPLRERRTVLLLLACAALNALNVVAYFGAIVTTSVGIAVLTHYLAPLLVALLAPFVDHERVRGAVPSALVALLGLALVLEPWHASARGVRLGAALGALSAVGYAGNVLTLKRLERRLGPARTLSWNCALALIFVAPFLRLGAFADAGMGRVAWFVLGCVLLGTVAGALFIRGLRVIGATRASMLAFLEPLVAVPVGWLAWSERPGWSALVGGAIILGASAWVSLAPRTGTESATA